MRTAAYNVGVASDRRKNVQSTFFVRKKTGEFKNGNFWKELF